MVAAGSLFTDLNTGYEYAGASYANVGYFKHDTIGTFTLEQATDENGDLKFDHYDNPVMEKVEVRAGTGTSGPCAACHMAGDAGHSYAVADKDDAGAMTAIKSSVCAACHKGANGAALVTPELVGTEFGFSTGTRTVTQDDVDAAAAFMQAEAEGYHGALEELETALLAAGYKFSPNYPYFNLVGGDGMPTTWVNQGNFGAAHNYNYLHHEEGAYAHNRYYAKRLIFDSIDWLQNGSLTGSIVVADSHAKHWLGADELTGVATRP
jgi:hypothetical protein